MAHTESPDFDRLAEGRQIGAEAAQDREEIKRLREALNEVISNGEFVGGEEGHEIVWVMPKEVYETAKDALEKRA